MTFGNPSFATGRHLAAARTMAGLKQSELAALAGIHVQNIKRLEAMDHIDGSKYAIGKIGKVLQEKGIHADRWPIPFVRYVDKPAVSRAA